MEPRIQYAKTSDGVNIAYYVMGDGPPLVVTSGYYNSHLTQQWGIPSYRRVTESLAEHFTVVRYDGGGSGLSDREPADYSLEARIRDIEAVAARAGLDEFYLYGAGHGAPAAAAYATQYRERVSRLVLYLPFASGSDLYRDSPRMRFVAGLESVTVEEQWEFTSLAIASRTVGPGDVALLQDLAQLGRASMGPRELLAFRDATKQIDVTPLLPQIMTPTLVMYAETDFVSLRYSRIFASSIPSAQLVIIHGPPGSVGTMSDEALAAMLRFLGVEEAAAPVKGKSVAPAAFQTILFTDIEGSTALTEHLGDAKAREVLREHEHSVREALAAHGGSEVKTMGDGFMASFGSATKALECAVAIQKAFGERNAKGEMGNGEESIRVRIGLNAGEPVAEEGDLFGTAVNMAARIAGQAQGGEILVSDVVRQLVAGKGFVFDDRGEQALKGFKEPVRVYEVRWV